MTFSSIVKIVKIVKIKKAATNRYRLNNTNWLFVMLLSSFALWQYRVWLLLVHSK